VGGLLLAFLSTKITKYAEMTALVTYFFIITVGVLALGFDEQSTAIIYVGSFMLGVADCFTFSLALSIAGRW
jgi:hypothetical protein